MGQKKVRSTSPASLDYACGGEIALNKLNYFYEINFCFIFVARNVLFWSVMVDLALMSGFIRRMLG